MKKSLLLFFVSFTFLLFSYVIYNINSTYALSYSPYITCNSSSLNVGESTLCNIYMNVSDSYVYGFDAYVNVSNGLSIVGSNVDSSKWQGQFNGNRVTVYTSNDLSGNVLIGSVTVKANSNDLGDCSISLSNVLYTDGDFASVNYSNPVSFSLRIKSNNNNLSSLSIDSLSLNPTFSSSNTNYSASTNNSSIVVNATPSDGRASVSGTGTISLNYGINNISVKVIAEDGSSKIYYINVNRNDTRSKDNNLKSLTIKGYNIAFNKDVTNYNVNVSKNVSSVDLSYVVNDSKSLANIEGSFSNLKAGSNIVKINVKAENGAVKTYVVNIVKEASEEEKKNDDASNIPTDNVDLNNKKEDIPNEKEQNKDKDDLNSKEDEKEQDKNVISGNINDNVYKEQEILSGDSNNNSSEGANKILISISILVLCLIGIVIFLLVKKRKVSM